jgi:hypothetical protein
LLTILRDPKHIRADLRMIRGAIRNGWDIEPDAKAEIVRRVAEIAEDPKTDRQLIKSAVTILRMIEDNRKRIDTAFKQLSNRWSKRRGGG